jgi:hypothetical protein
MGEGSGNWLAREDSERVNAYGRTYQYISTATSRPSTSRWGSISSREDCCRRTISWCSGGGALGGFIHSDFDYDAINRLFSFEGGQVGGYATYLRSGLFVWSHS